MPFDPLVMARYDLALEEIGRRYANRAGLLDPLDIREVIARWSESPDDAIAMAAWLAVELSDL